MFDTAMVRGLLAMALWMWAGVLIPLGLVASNVDAQTMIADYPMNEPNWSGPAPQVVDATGNGHNGTAVGGATTINDQTYGWVGGFNGSNQYVILSGSYSMGGARSITAWVDPASNQDSLGMPIVTGGASGAGDFFGVTGTGGENSYLPQYELYIDHWFYPAFHSTSFVTPNTWNQVVMTYNGSGTVAFYINGQPASFETNASASQVSLYNYDFSSYAIGGNTIGGTTTQGSFDGLMRDVEFYNYVLSTSQVANLYQSESISTSVPTWSTSAGGSWSNPSNWTGSVPNGVGAGAAFTAGTTSPVTVTLDMPVTLGTLAFGNSASTSSGYTLVGGGTNTLTFSNSGNGATITVTDGTHAINAPVILADNLTVTTGSTSPWTLSFGTASSITDNRAGYSLTMSGNGGVLVLSGSNTYSGRTTISAGAILLNNPNAVPYSTVTVGVNNGLLFNTNSGAITTFNLGGLAGSGNVSLADGSHALTLSAGGNGAGTIYSGALSGPGGLTKVGGGTLTLTASNTYSGGTNVNAGTLQIGNGGSGASIGGTSGVSIASNATLAFNDADTVTFAPTISGAGNLVKTGNGTLTLTASNTYSGGTTVNVGSLVAVGQSYTAPGAVAGPLGSGPITLNNGTLVMALAANSTNPTTVDLVSGNAITLAGNNDSIIAGANPTGTVSLSNGTINLAGAGGTIAIAASQVLNLGESNGYTLTIDPDLQFSNSGTISAGPGSIFLSAGNLAVAGTLIAASGGTLTVGGLVTSGTYAPATAGTLFLSGTYSGSLKNLTPAAGGALVINDNTSSGTLTIAAATYVATNNASFGPATLALDGGTLAATTALTGSNAIANPLALSISFSGGGMPHTLYFGGSSSLELSSPLVLTGGTTAINDPGGVGILSGVISGAGTLSLFGNPTLSNSNTYTGGTRLNSGEVTITNNRGFGTGKITFNGGGFQATTPLAGPTAITNPWQIIVNSAAYFGAPSGSDAIQLSAGTLLPAFGTESIYITNPNMTVTLSGTITGNSNLTLASGAAGQVNGTLVLNNPGNSFQYFTLESLGGYVDVQGASTTGPAGSPTKGPLGTQTITLGTTNAGEIGLLNSSPIPVTLSNPVSIYDGCNYISASGIAFTGPVTLTGPGQGSTNNGLIDFSLGAGSIIAFTGPISGSDGINLRSGSGALSLDGPGTLILSGSDSYTGGTNVTAGTLEITNAAALPSGTSLTIGARGTSVFDPTMTADPLRGCPAVVGAASSAAAVSEPSTLALLAVGALGLAGGAWKRYRQTFSLVRQGRCLDGQEQESGGRASPVSR